MGLLDFLFDLFLPKETPREEMKYNSNNCYCDSYNPCKFWKRMEYDQNGLCSSPKKNFPQVKEASGQCEDWVDRYCI